MTTLTATFLVYVFPSVYHRHTFSLQVCALLTTSASPLLSRHPLDL